MHEGTTAPQAQFGPAIRTHAQGSLLFEHGHYIFRVDHNDGVSSLFQLEAVSNSHAIFHAAASNVRPQTRMIPLALLVVEV